MKKILIVDDEMFVRFLYRETLSDTYIIDEASDGFDALDKITSEKFDLMLVDMNIPFMNGMEVLRNIKSKGIDLRSIVISAYSNEDRKIEALELGAVEYLVKPIDIEELKAKIEKWC